ncbi:SMP-30/gluconolactonase/LRE family protein [Polymorphobacter fuscus]|uniref:SMP-30/gluconolactonase/LRE family protein n=1 Tax=Sandarakinorhabdus fusca TaxID=1439888 RepID=A0A7C9GYR5_9SPHN|nr:SMP-30/gluconolactonase/LRE family protein [Polymorphobacter fuscus]KAB7644872.1 SMP-30/gluconolactonase/LRE family protein [Polymorphobacter fuscus]MQT18154.1 SMP-30/gluconolactonase/LRE family protein [Polymorphobacter fuscus]NJC09472.1 sugar lactone lactonase YvrE [Polymorphobacter fuscus]
MTDYRIVPRDAHDILGEGPVWSARRNALLWVDIMGQQLWSLSLADDRITSWPMPERIGWVVERAGRDDLLAGFKSGIVTLALDPLCIAPLHRPEPDRPHNRLNDAKVDAAGRLWFGSKDDRDQDASGALYRLDPGGTPVRIDDGYKVTNGPAFSPDGRWLYHTDSGLGRVYRFALGDDGSLGPRALFIQFETGWGSPDGMTIDADGHLWIAHWGGGRISRFDPAGRLVDSVALPATNITSCAFAGPGLDRLFATSSTIDAEGEPDAGALFEIRTGVIGLPPHCHAG